MLDNILYYDFFINELHKLRNFCLYQITTVLSNDSQQPDKGVLVSEEACYWQIQNCPTSMLDKKLYDVFPQMLNFTTTRNICLCRITPVLSNDSQQPNKSVLVSEEASAHWQIQNSPISMLDNMLYDDFFTNVEFHKLLEFPPCIR